MSTVQVDHASHAGGTGPLRTWRSRPPRDGVWRGLLAGLAPNVVVFAALFATPWPDEHLPTWLALGTLYAVPVLVAVVGLHRLRQPATRRRGAGLLLSAPLTVALWYAAVWVDLQVAMAGTTPGG